MARGARKVQTFMVKRKNAVEGELPQLIHGTHSQVQSHVVEQHTIEPASAFELVELGKKGVEIQQLSAS